MLLQIIFRFLVDEYYRSLFSFYLLRCMVFFYVVIGWNLFFIYFLGLLFFFEFIVKEEIGWRRYIYLVDNLYIFYWQELVIGLSLDVKVDWEMQFVYDIRERGILYDFIFLLIKFCENFVDDMKVKFGVLVF